MKPSFEDFIKIYFSNSNKFYPYQKEILNNIQNSNKLFDIHKIQLIQRQYARRFEHSLRLYWNLLNNNSVLDLFLGLHFQFEVNDYDQLELIIDEYSQIPPSKFYAGSVGTTGSNINQSNLQQEFKDKKKECHKMLQEALDVINGGI